MPARRMHPVGSLPAVQRPLDDHRPMPPTLATLADGSPLLLLRVATLARGVYQLPHHASSRRTPRLTKARRRLCIVDVCKTGVLDKAACRIVGPTRTGFDAESPAQKTAAEVCSDLMGRSHPRCQSKTAFVDRSDFEQRSD